MTLLQTTVEVHSCCYDSHDNELCSGLAITCNNCNKNWFPDRLVSWQEIDLPKPEVSKVRDIEDRWPNCVRMAFLETLPELSVLKLSNSVLLLYQSWPLQRLCPHIVLWFHRGLELLLHHLKRMFILTFLGNPETFFICASCHLQLFIPNNTYTCIYMCLHKSPFTIMLKAFNRDSNRDS